MNNSGTDTELVREIELTDIETFYRRFSLRQGLSASTGLKKTGIEVYTDEMAKLGRQSINKSQY